ncbi:MAG: SCO family protein [Ferruginibacter sp.]
MNKTVIGIGVMVITIISMLWIYNVQETKQSEKLPRCFPTGEMFPFKDANGRIKYDSVYHTIADFKLTDQNGNTITNQSLKTKIYVANFFFCRCGSICPKMTNNILLLQDDFKNESGIAFLSHTVNPENDSVKVLKEYEKRYHINGNKWHLLTGSRQELYDLSKRSHYLGVANDSPDEFEHSEKLVLVDDHRIIRGFYNGTDAREVEKLKEDIKTLLREQKRNANNL